MLPILTGAKLNGYLLFKFSCHSPLYSPEITPLIKQISGDGSVEFFLVVGGVFLVIGSENNWRRSNVTVWFVDEVCLL